MMIGRILVPVDFWTSSAQVLGVGLDLATVFDAELTILHVWDFPARAYPGMALSEVDHVLAPVRAAAQAELDRLLAEARRRRPCVHGVLRCGPTESQILAEITETAPDLVVAGSHGRTGLARALLGSIAEYLVRFSPAPVLLVPVRADDTPL